MEILSCLFLCPDKFAFKIIVEYRLRFDKTKVPTSGQRNTIRERLVARTRQSALSIKNSKEGSCDEKEISRNTVLAI